MDALFLDLLLSVLFSCFQLQTFLIPEQHILERHILERCILERVLHPSERQVGNSKPAQPRQPPSVVCPTHLQTKREEVCF